MTTAGLAYCRGDNTDAQLGTGDTNKRLSPSLVAGGHTWRTLTTSTASEFTGLLGGVAHTCGITMAGEAFCWGGNGLGNLGTGSSEPTITTPARVLGAHSWSAVSTGAHYACGITTSDSAFCWGFRPPFGPSGIVAPPVPLPGGHSCRSVSLNVTRGCGVTTTGTAFCWGANDTGQLGTGDTVDETTPTPVLDPR